MTKEEVKTIVENCLKPISFENKRFETDKKSGKCLICKKYYKYPGMIFYPRQLICNSCENYVRVMLQTRSPKNVRQTLEIYC